MIALTYGLVSSAAADPIEKKPVFHFRPGTRVFSVGSVGCSMRCGHCQNWQISRAGPSDAGMTSFVEPEEVVNRAIENGCEGVAWTYNEPVIWLEYVLDCAALAKRAGLYTVMVTNGYVTAEGLSLFADHVDVWRTDVKGFSEASYHELCHVRHADAVRTAAAAALHEHGMHVECVTNVVPTVNDSDEELRAIASWIAGALSPNTPWHVTRFIPYLDFSHLDPTPLHTLERAVAIGREEGLRYVYLGNVATPGGEDTRCPSCGKTVISREGYSVRMQGVDAGGCAHCGHEMPIRF
jgi:pyruvate formate lyase activating enzyme